jgi:hypothetical protein
MILQEIWQLVKKHRASKDLLPLPVYLEKPLAIYLNCPAVVCSKCLEQTSYYTQFSMERILCSDCHPQPN